jgi:uncharacterized protein YcaQ
VTAPDTPPRRRLQRLSLGQARRVALAAQGFTDRRPARPDARAVTRVVGRTGLFQIDSVNVVTRAQYMPLFSRVGPYDVGVLDRAFGTRGAACAASRRSSPSWCGSCARRSRTGGR